MDPADTLAIHHLIALYGHAADACDRELIAQVFTQDAVWEAPGESFEDAAVSTNRWEGIEAIFGMFEMGVPPNSPSHHTTNVRVHEKDGEVRVKSKWIAHPEKRSVWMGDYDDVVVKTPAGWRIRHRVATFRYAEG
jgi:SnoaL-like domain